MKFPETGAYWWRNLVLPILEPESGVYRAEVLYSRLEQELAKAQREGTSFSLLLLEVQPSNGRRPRSDSVMAITSALVSTARQEDVPARLAPRRFALLLPGVEGAVAARVGRAIERGLRPVMAETEEGWRVSCLNYPAEREQLERLIAVVNGRRHSREHNARHWAAA